jgi:hypothetical protein
MMNIGKIMIGFSLILLSIAMMISPSAATGPGYSCEVGCRITLSGVAGDNTGPHPGSPGMFTPVCSLTYATYPYER